MKLLLDTNAWLFSLLEPDRLSPPARTALDDSESELALSPITPWETVLLGQRGRLALEPDPATWVRRAVAATPAQMIPLDFEVALRSRQLADYPGADPADRFLIATCLIHGRTLLTADKQIRAWDGVPTLW